MPFDLVDPTLEHLPGFVHALRQGWSPDNLRPDARFEHLARIEADPDRYIREQIDREASGPPITLSDNTTVPRLPGITLWMWDGEFCGSIGLRWQPGTTDLPPYCLGHVGYAVVPWKQRRGYATRALQMLLPYARAECLPFIELTTDEANIASQRVIEANGGVLVERFKKPQVHGGAESVRYRIDL